VDNISFAIQAGEILGLAGESGCGKTLTALSVAGLLPRPAKITGGEILFRPEGSNVLLNSLGEEELCRIRGKEISFIFQEARQSLNPLIRVGPQITETLELHGSRDREETRGLALDMLAKLGFDRPAHIFHAFPHELSGGMCQRVMIAIAAICRPRLLLADEPTAGLDSASQDQFLSLLAEINRDYGTAILFISHDLSIVRRFCHRFLIMYAGKIVEEGPAQTLFSPAHPYTRGLVNAIPDRQQRGKPLANIPGMAPAIQDRLPGCPFAPRCPNARDSCTTAFPVAKDIGGGHRSYCIL
jgi:peptide/nickel transport system ATP-binding protein